MLKKYSKNKTPKNFENFINCQIEIITYIHYQIKKLMNEYQSYLDNKKNIKKSRNIFICIL